MKRREVFKTYTSTEYKRERGEFGKTHSRDNVCQEVLEAEDGEYLPWKGFNKSQGSFMLVKTGLGEQGIMTLYTLWRKVFPGQVFFSLQPADFSCSCYTTSFQKNEGL